MNYAAWQKNFLVSTAQVRLALNGRRTGKSVVLAHAYRAVPPEQRIAMLVGSLRLAMSFIHHISIPKDKLTLYTPYTTAGPNGSRLEEWMASETFDHIFVEEPMLCFPDKQVRADNWLGELLDPHIKNGTRVTLVGTPYYDVEKPPAFYWTYRLREKIKQGALDGAYFHATALEFISEDDQRWLKQLDATAYQSEALGLFPEET